jgi:hypothetical protein
MPSLREVLLGKAVAQECMQARVPDGDQATTVHNDFGIFWQN